MPETPRNADAPNAEAGRAQLRADFERLVVEEEEVLRRLEDA